jgi:hypothetical protein
MKRHLAIVISVTMTSLSWSSAMADNQSLDAALGGALGGGLGALVGNEIGGRSGAIVGGGLGAAAGAAVTTREERRDPPPRVYRDRGYWAPDYYDGPPGSPGRFCPPGQAKKGRC